MELYKVTLPYGKKKFYESKRMFDKHWPRNEQKSNYGSVSAYILDWNEREWRCIRTINKRAGLNYYSG
jgi:hypothetical protein